MRTLLLGGLVLALALVGAHCQPEALPPGEGAEEFPVDDTLVPPELKEDLTAEAIELANNGQLLRSLPIFFRVARDNKDDVEALANAGVAFMRLGFLEEAWEAFMMAKKVDPTNDVLKENIATWRRERYSSKASTPFQVRFNGKDPASVFALEEQEQLEEQGPPPRLRPIEHVQGGDEDPHLDAFPRIRRADLHRPENAAYATGQLPFVLTDIGLPIPRLGRDVVAKLAAIAKQASQAPGRRRRDNAALYEQGMHRDEAFVPVSPTTPSDGIQFLRSTARMELEKRSAIAVAPTPAPSQKSLPFSLSKVKGAEGALAAFDALDDDEEEEEEVDEEDGGGAGAGKGLKKLGSGAVGRPGAGPVPEFGLEAPTYASLYPTPTPVKREVPYVLWSPVEAEWDAVRSWLELDSLPSLFTSREDWRAEIFPDPVERDVFEDATRWRLITVGVNGTGMFLHWDSNHASSWQLQLAGRKRWFVCPPRMSSLLRSAGGYDGFETDRFIFGQLGGLHCYDDIVEPGEILFYPKGYWHQTMNLADNDLAEGRRPRSAQDAALRELEASRRPLVDADDHLVVAVSGSVVTTANVYEFSASLDQDCRELDAWRARDGRAETFRPVTDEERASFRDPQNDVSEDSKDAFRPVTFRFPVSPSFCHSIRARLLPWLWDAVGGDLVGRGALHNASDPVRGPRVTTDERAPTCVRRRK